MSAGGAVPAEPGGASPAASPLPPRRTYRVGVTGHRDLAAYDSAAIRASLRSILGLVRDAVAGTPPTLGLNVADPARTVLLSALAKGADQVAAEEALDLGYVLHAPLPFLREVYERDFAGDADSLVRHRALLARAERVFEIGAARDEVSTEARGRAYLAVGRLVLANCDLLLAVWNGQPQRGTGGTAGVVAEALDAGIPVVIVPPRTPDQAHLCVSEPGRPSGETSLEGLSRIVRRTLDPFSPDGLPPGPAGEEEARILATQRAHYRSFLAEIPPRARPWPVRSVREAVVRTWAVFLRLVAGARDRAAVVRRSQVPPAPPALQAHRDRVDRVAGHYRGLYRGAFLLNYLFGALAVSLALLGLLSAATGAYPGLAHVLPVLEIVAIAAIAFLFWRGRIGRWHEKGVNYRVLAELFRQHASLAPLGLAVASTRPRAHLGGEADLSLSWMAAHFRAVVRDEGLGVARFTPEALASARTAVLDGWIRGQEAYHRETARVLGRAEHRLHAATLVLFVGAALACSMHLFWHGGAGPWLSALAAGLPAWAAALHGILGHAELERLAERSAGMAVRLHDLAERLAAVPDADLTYRAIAEVATVASDAMLHENDDWQALSRGGDVPLP